MTTTTRTRVTDLLGERKDHLMFEGRSLQVLMLDATLAELRFDAQDGSVNKLDQRTLRELSQAVALLTEERVRGLLITSAKDGFIVGADINEFGALFKLSESELVARNLAANRVFTALETLPMPIVAAVNGSALGGGLELALTADWRVLSSTAQVGLPEVKLGLLPGLGGTVRLPRVANFAIAIEWITSGKSWKASVAANAGVADAVVEPAQLRERAIELLREASNGALDWLPRRQAKRGPLPISALETEIMVSASRQVLLARLPKHQPAPLAALQLLERSASAARDEALTLEAHAFASMARTQAADALVQTFLSDQIVRKRSRQLAGSGRATQRVAVLGAGIMGGGIAYTSAISKMAVRMKDIKQQQLDLGMSEAAKQLNKQVAAGRITQPQAATLLKAIVPQLDYAGLGDVDVVVEAVVEDLAIKHRVLAEVEAHVGPEAIIASNTSSLRIDLLTQPLARPQNLVGLHFFNPVPVMPLVEVIRGRRSSDEAVASVVSYALALGKIPIVVKDGPGFLVNRILTPYMQAFGLLVAQGADFVQVDAAMEAFGWPMGPAYLNDVVGMDTGMHVAKSICAGFGQRLQPTTPQPLNVMVAQGRFGQKSGAGFYRYEVDPQGKPKKLPAAESYSLLASIQSNGQRDFAAHEITDRMMLPLLVEAALCLEEGMVASAAELDLAMLLGVGFPQYLGGPLKYADWLGLGKVVELCDRYADLGPLYAATERMREMARRGQKYY